jgi:hypothetical protein
MRNAELEVVASFPNALAAETAVGALRAAGIETITRRDDSGGQRPQLWLSGVDVMVRADDAPRARGILKT